MGIAALILGVVSLFISFFPFCGAVALLPGIIGLMLGIIDIVIKSRNGQSKALGIVGTVLNGLALLVAILWGILLVITASAAVSDPAFPEKVQKVMEEVRESKQAGQGTVVVERVEVPAPPPRP
ncbi:hypothetical protein SDC9_195795 [bioreactor metagenome]|uniref:DUF4190 domain-containing protein n=1 Tax=bioreactor metagenome TaxID=1076179 RepID=A0A645IAP1_9ZZZZ